MQRSPLIESTLRAFSTCFGGEPLVLALSPARVELLGNHTDHNDGLVLAAAIDRASVVAIRPARGSHKVAHVRSVNLDQHKRFSIGEEIPHSGNGSWLSYVAGVSWALAQAYGPLSAGFEMVIAGDIPLGAGLSSSASLQATVAIAIGAAGLINGPNLVGDDASRMDLAKLLRRAENEYVGVNSGLLDHVSTLFGRADHALTLDCRSFDYARVPLGSPAPALIVCDTMTSRKLADGMYNLRRAECQSVVSYFQSHVETSNITSLRDVTADMLRAHWAELDLVGRLRARHVLTENARVTAGAVALKQGEVAEFGRLMSASHASSRDNFENSSPALNTLVEAAENAPGFLGGKLSGAGWAGCTVNLVEADKAEPFAESVMEGYLKQTGTRPNVHICRSADGGSVYR